MEIKKEFNYENLRDEVWSGATETLKVIEENNKEQELMDLLENVFIDKIPTITEVNDFLWFEDDFIFETLEIGV